MDKLVDTLLARGFRGLRFRISPTIGYIVEVEGPVAPLQFTFDTARLGVAEIDRLRG